MSFLRHAEIYRSDVVYKTFESLGRGAASRWSAPGAAEGRSPKDRALLIVRDEFPGWLFLGGLLSSRARFRFTNRPQYSLRIDRWQRLVSEW